MNNTLHNRLRHHVTGAIERGEAQAIVEIPALHKGPFPLEIIKSDDKFIAITNHGTHYATTYDPSAARLISAAPDLLSALEFLLADYIAINGEKLTGSDVPLNMALSAIAKAKGEK